MAVDLVTVQITKSCTVVLVRSMKPAAHLMLCAVINSHRKLAFEFHRPRKPKEKERKKKRKTPPKKTTKLCV